jgi:acetoin utilization protein AcuB
MTRNVLTASPHTSHREAVEIMRQNRIRRLPVVDNGKLAGIISEKDLLSAQPSAATTLSIYEIYTLLDKLTVKQIMKHPVVTVGPDCPLEDAAQIMIQRKIGCLPVMDNGQLVGIITETDVLKVLVEVLGGGEPGIHFTVRLTDQPGTLAKLSDAIAHSGGNIISVTSYRAPDKNHRDVSIKETGADPNKLREYLEQAGAELMDIQKGFPHQPELYGAR